MGRLKSIPPDEGAAQWNSFAREQSSLVPHSFHPSLLNFYTAYFDWKAYYFLLYDENKPVGIFPLIDSGRCFVSLPHFSYGGFIQPKNKALFNTGTTALELIRLVRKEKPSPGFLAFQTEKQNNTEKQPVSPAEKLFIRSMMKFDGSVKSNKVSSMIYLADDKEKMWGLLSPNLRRKLRKTMKNGLEAKHGRAELLDEFYQVYARNMHRLGSPVYAKSFFRSLLLSDQSGEARIFISTINGKTVGAAFLMSYFGFYENTWFATNRAFKKYLVSDHLHWQMVQFAIENRGSVYSMGRSTGSESVHRYKKHWPVTDKPLFTYELNRAPGLKKYQWLASIWKMFPYHLTLLLGPRLVRHIY
ncbi:MAG: GNAT family N-acetyltransferase [Bacteroidales bacterium]|nr:GNAT family N-acetyltransferase [Bacteroidales bacterium]MCF6342870.1 GNAT family N-acetyltransferase [Bacteroidales bacterium]